MQRAELRVLQKRAGSVTWLQYCTDSAELARYYRAAELLVHPGVQETFGLRRSRARPAARRWSGFAAATWTASFLAARNIGRRKIPPERLSGRDGRRGEPRKPGLAAAERVREHYAWPVVFAQLFRLYRSARELSRRLRNVARSLRTQLPCEKRAAH